MTNLTGLAQSYVAASNAHDAEACAAMFADGASYVSVGVGEHQGRDAIRTMMTGFFSTYPDVHWSCEDWREEPDAAVSFRFYMAGHHAETGALLERRDIERIWFDGHGKISRIEVGRVSDG